MWNPSANSTGQYSWMPSTNALFRNPITIQPALIRDDRAHNWCLLQSNNPTLSNTIMNISFWCHYTWFTKPPANNNRIPTAKTCFSQTLSEDGLHVSWCDLEELNMKDACHWMAFWDYRPSNHIATPMFDLLHGNPVVQSWRLLQIPLHQPCYDLALFSTSNNNHI